MAAGEFAIDKLLNTTVANGAADLHLKVGSKPMVRLGQKLCELETRTLTQADTHSLFKSSSEERHQNALRERGSVDYAFALGDKARFRVNVCNNLGSVRLVFRRLPNEIIPLEKLALPSGVEELSMRYRGLLLVTGPTGSGKTTSLAALIRNLADKESRHIIMIEEPTEYKLESTPQTIITQREVGTDLKTFRQGLVDALRQDPDVIVVGELRDAETVKTAIQAADTGHLVLGTLHTTTAEGTINRLIGEVPGDEKEATRAKLADTLCGVLCQQLLPLKEGGGVVGAYEFLRVTPAISNLIRKGDTYRIGGEIQVGAKYGMQLLDDHLAKLVTEGVVEPKEAIAKANDAHQMMDRVRKARQVELDE